MKKLILLIFIAALVTLFFWFDLRRYFALEALKANHQALVDIYVTHRAATVAVFIAGYIVQTALSLPGAAILSITAGAIFGVLMGTLYAVIGATIGATLAFLVTRYLFHDAVQRKFGEKLGTLNAELERSGLNYLLFLRLVPIFPFFLINLGAGLTKLPLRTFFVGTLIGIIPGGFVYVNAGASLAAIERVGDIASPRILGSFALLGLFALVPVLYRKIRGPGAGDRGTGTIRKQ
jgi:uncharacterized membrane protein YdjX (TVP38/TMEM64 family)